MLAPPELVGYISCSDETAYERLVNGAAPTDERPEVEETVILAARLWQLRADLWAQWQSVQTPPLGSRRVRP